MSSQPSSSPYLSSSISHMTSHDHPSKSTPVLPSTKSSPLSKNTTPTLRHSPLSEPPPSTSSFSFRPRGQSASALHRNSPKSQATLPPIPSEGDSDEHAPSSVREPSRSPLMKFKDLPTPMEEQGSQTPPYGAPSTWWTRTEIVPRPWKETPRRKKTIPPEQTEAWIHTRSRVAQAAVSVLGTAGDVAHEALLLSVDLLNLAPVIGLSEAARTLLNIWDALQHVDMNRLACLRLTERCADILISVREEIAEAGDDVGEELRTPLAKLVESFTQVQEFLQKQVHRPFLKRYLKRDEILQQIATCDASLCESLGMFSLSIQIRILKQVQNAELRRQADTQALLSSFIGSHQGQSLLMSDGLPPVPLSPTTPTTPELLPPLTSLPLSLTTPPAPPPKSPISPMLPALPTSPMLPALPTIPIPTTVPTTPLEIRSNLRALHTLQNELDQARDTVDLRQLLRVALLTSSDAEMIEVLQVGRDEMPEAIKTLQRALEKEVGVVVDGRKGSTVVAQTPVPDGDAVNAEASRSSVAGLARANTIASRESGGSGASAKDTLDREFIESGIDVLRRMSRGAEINLPSWTITRYEVDREEKIGIGFFSDVYRGTWRSRTVAIKVLAPTAPQSVFVREVQIWKTLKHVNVLELYGASSTFGDPPWFFVSPYMKQGSLVKYLKGLEGERRGRGNASRGRSPSAGRRNEVGNGSGSGNGRQTDEVDMLKMMYEVAKGMEYLHSMGVLHGDLKGANVLVDDKIRCVIADFGQSELKSEAYRMSGTVPPPHGTLRWQAPELMAGQNQLTTEIDVYAYAITCVEILTMGSLPWMHMDDEAVRRFVLKDKTRPPLPRAHVNSLGLAELLKICWHHNPFQRPAFSKVVNDLKMLRLRAGGNRMSMDTDDVRSMSGKVDSVSPDIRPIALPHSSPVMDDKGLSVVVDGDVFSSSEPVVMSPGSSDESYKTAMVDVSSSPPTHEPYVPEGHIQKQTSQPVYFLPSGNPSRASSLFTTNPWGSGSGSSGSEEGGNVFDYAGYDSPRPATERMAHLRNERRYRMLLTHEFHPSLTLPLWTPSPISLGAVGYLSKPRGAFVTLFNAFDPIKSSEGIIMSMPSLYGYGNVAQGSHRQEKRTMAQKGLDVISGLLTFKNKGDGHVSQNVSRRYSFPLRAGHRAACLYTETTVYRYLDNLETPKKWFKANVDGIMQVFGARYSIQKEDLYLVIGTLDAADYALFVSHQHPDGQVHFNVFSSLKPGRYWGMFTTDTNFPQDRGGPSYHEEVPGHSDWSSASKVSLVSNHWDTLLVARLRFKPDALEPTSL